MNGTPEARIALCKCGETKKIYGVRFERYQNGWKYTWAFPIKEDTAEREHYGENVLKGELVKDEEYPGCPYCKTNYFLICSCGKLNCNTGKKPAQCEWCGAGGAVEDYSGGGIKAGTDR